MFARLTTIVLLNALLFTILVRVAVGAEVPIPSISIPPEAQYLAQRVSEKYVSFCKERVACLPPLAFATSADRARMLTFMRSKFDGPLTVTEYEGPAETRGGSNVIIRTSRHSVTIAGDGKLTAYAGAMSNDDFEKNSTDTQMSWGEVTDLLDAVDQFLTSLAEHEKRMARSPGKDV